MSDLLKNIYQIPCYFQKNTLSLRQKHIKITRTRLYVLLSALVFVIAIGAIAYATCSKAMTAERHARYAGIMNIASEK